jgi:hypothetical protein
MFGMLADRTFSETHFIEPHQGNDSPHYVICGLMVSVADYKHRGPWFDFRALLKIFLRELGLERGPLSLVIG